MHRHGTIVRKKLEAGNKGERVFKSTWLLDQSRTLTISILGHKLFHKLTSGPSGPIFNGAHWALSTNPIHCLWSTTPTYIPCLVGNRSRCSYSARLEHCQLPLLGHKQFHRVEIFKNFSGRTDPQSSMGPTGPHQRPALSSDPSPPP